MRVRRGVAALGFECGLILAAALLLWQPVSVALMSLAASEANPEGTSVEAARLAFAVLGLAACVTGTLTLQYPGRPNVSLVLLPAALAWWQLGPGPAGLLAGFGALFGSAWRRAPALASLAGGARTALAVWLGALAAQALVIHSPPTSSTWFSAAWLLAALLFAVIASAVDWGFDALDRRLSGPSTSAAIAASHPTFTGWSPNLVSRGIEQVGRMDPLVNLLILPLALAFQVVAVALGFERMAIVLGGMLALLFVVRALTNLHTAYAALAEQRIKLATLFDQSGEGIFTVDGALRIETLNPAMAELLGQPADTLARQACAAVCHFQDLQGRPLCPAHCPLVAAHARQRPVTQEVLYQAPDLPPKHILLTYASVSAPGEPLSLGIGIARDMTAEREAAKLRDEFVSLVTHELRSPLTVSIGYLDLLKRALTGGDRALDAEKGAYYTTRIEGGVRHLLRLVNNLLELARVERPDLQLELGWIELGRLVRETVDGMAMLAHEKGQELELHLPPDVPTIWSSELYLKEVLGNLVSNGVKYTPEGGRVSVALRVSDVPRTGVAGETHDTPEAHDGHARARAADGGGMVQIIVSDTGYGMSEEDQAQLFSKFFRSGQPEIRRERGTGLGLALTKQMVEKLGGSITVQSELGAGSTFTVTLPLTATGPDGTLGPPPEALSEAPAGELASRVVIRK